MSQRNFIRLNLALSFITLIVGSLSSLLEILPINIGVSFAIFTGLLSLLLVSSRDKVTEVLSSVVLLTTSIIAFSLQNLSISGEKIRLQDLVIGFLLLVISSTIIYFYKYKKFGILFGLLGLGYLTLRFLNIIDLKEIFYFSLLLISPFILLIREKKLMIISKLFIALLAVGTIAQLQEWGRLNLLNRGRVLFIATSVLILALLLVGRKVKSSKIIATITLGALVFGFMPQNYALSSKFVNESKTKKVALQREKEVGGYRLPGVGYKDELRGKTFKECDEGSTMGRDCFITIYVDLAKEKGVEFALNDVINAINSVRGQHFASHCHQVTHAIGTFAGATDYKKNPIGGLKLEPQVCATGYTHGIFETYWKPYDNEELKAKAATACADLGMVEGFYRWTCNHILGHVLVTRDELNPGPQLRACLKITDEHSANDCLSGGWMQFFSDDPILAMFKEKDATYADIFKYCNDEPLQSQRMCYQETFPSLSIIKNSNFASEMQDCKKASDETNFVWCVQGVARAIAITGGYTVPYAKAECAKTEEGDVRDYCYTASAASITLNMGSALETGKMCDLVKDKEVKAYCQRWVRDSRGLIASGPNSENMPDK